MYFVEILCRSSLTVADVSAVLQLDVAARGEDLSGIY
jgi:hypothetical protein